MEQYVVEVFIMGGTEPIKRAFADNEQTADAMKRVYTEYAKRAGWNVVIRIRHES
jgi:hypothetical protein